MKTDRELLEVAAKAAGIEYDKETTEKDYRFGLWLTLHGEPTEFTRRSWNPLTDDGDALRLAVKLKIDFYTGEDDGEAAYAGFFDVTMNNRQRFAIERFENRDHYVATRRAIVRAAAAIGKANEKVEVPAAAD